MSIFPNSNRLQLDRAITAVQYAAAIAFVSICTGIIISPPLLGQYISASQLNSLAGNNTDSAVAAPISNQPVNPTVNPSINQPVNSTVNSPLNPTVNVSGANIARQNSYQSCTFRIAWTGKAHQWRGQIEIVNPNSAGQPGSILEAYSLALESDQAAAYSVRNGVLYIHHPAPREYDGYNISAIGQTGLKLRITLSADNQPPQTFEIKWEELFNQAFQFQIGDSKASIKRTVGDYLRLRLNRDNLVYSPSETFSAILTPYQLAAEGLTSYNPATIKVQLRHSQEQFEIYKKEYTWSPESDGDIPLSIQLPQEEGVYDIIITASCSKLNSLMPRVSGAVNKQLENVRLQSARELVVRKIQLAVVDSSAAVSDQVGAMETKLTAEIDPANSQWWKSFERLSPFSLGMREKQWEYPLGNGNTRISQCELGPVTELATNRSNEEPCWEAYTFPIERPGIPHILEIEYPSNSEQTTGVSIVEANDNGAITPSNLDSGFNVTQDSLRSSEAPEWKTHKIIFWPKTKNPVLLVYNLREDTVSRFGKIRVMAVAGKLPRGYAGNSSRLVAAYLDRPQFTKMFSAKMALFENTSMLLDDWETFYQGGTRMIEYLNHVGYNGAMISVNCDGGAIWPCMELAPTPRYDTGLFAPVGNDPVRKDVLELLMRLFDRQKMRLIPAMEFTQPIPKLETLVRLNDSRSSGLQWIGPDGKSFLETYPPEKGAAMYYNILHPQVQQAVLDVVSHLTTRYRHHPGFTGLAMQLSDNSWLILPPPQWGMDDQTVAQFTADTGIPVPGEGENRFATRAKYLTGPALTQWLKWRSDKLENFYCKMRDCVQSDGKNRRLYLSGAKLFTRCHRNVLLPRLPQTITAADAMLQCGFNGNYGLNNAHDIVLMYTQRVLNGQSLKQSAPERQWSVISDAGSYFDSRNGQRIQASLFYHPSRQVRLASFEQKSPYKPTYALLNSVPTPASWENRCRFAQSLTMWDTQEFFDGGWTLSLGEEDALRNFIAAVRCLPNTGTHQWQTAQPSDEQTGSMQQIQLETANQSRAIVTRWVSDGQSTWAYCINTTPYRINGKIRILANAAQGGSSAPTTVTRMDNIVSLFAQSNSKGNACTDNNPQLLYEGNNPVWQSAFAPFEMQVIRLNAPVALAPATVTWDAQTLAAMQKRLYDLAGRIESLKTAKPMRILDNPDFELTGNGNQPIPHWFVWKNPNQPDSSATNAMVDYRAASSGQNSLHLISDGWPAAVYSKDIAIDTTGRFTVSMWIKKAPSVPLRCFIRVKSGDKHVYRDTVFVDNSVINDMGTANNLQNVVNQINSQYTINTANKVGDWTQYYFHVNDLPLEKMGDICLGFELSSAGEVWVDNIHISDLYFPESEQRMLYKMLVPLGAKYSQGELEYCWKFQQGYWPQFLMDCVELDNNHAVAQIGASSPYGVAPINGAVGQNGTALALPAPPTAAGASSSAPTELSGSTSHRPLFGLGLGRTNKSDVQLPTPAITEQPKPEPKPEPESKTFWQRTTGWLKWY